MVSEIDVVPGAARLVSSVPAEAPSLGEQLLNQVVAFRPIREVEVETSRARAWATLARVVAIDENAHRTDYGELHVFWKVVRDQIRRQSTPEAPWVAGVMSQEGRAYQLRPLTDAQVQQIGQVIADLGE